MQVRELMSTDLVTVGRTSTLRDAVETLLANRVGSVLVVDGETPVGILTESDALLAACRTDRPLTEIPVRAAMSSPIEHVRPSATVLSAVRRMREAGVKKLLVRDGLDVEGILTVTDVARAMEDVRDEAAGIARTHRDWEQSERFW